MRTPLIGDEDPLSRLAQARNAATESAAAGSDSGKAGPTEEEQDTAATSEVNVDVEKGGGGGGGGGGGDDGEEEYERECRICGGGDEDGALMNPCACTGSMSLIHADCLRKWIETRRQNNAHGHGGTSADPMRCEICHENYAIRVRDEFVCDYEHVCTCTSCGHITEGIILLFCLGCMIFMMCILAPTLGRTELSEKTLLIVLFIVTVVLSCLALRKVYQRWRFSSSQQVIEAAAEGGEYARAEDIVIEEDMMRI